jgi:hypothetical protein
VFPLARHQGRADERPSVDFLITYRREVKQDPELVDADNAPLTAGDTRFSVGPP